jgi:hypothetical protein
MKVFRGCIFVVFIYMGSFCISLVYRSVSMPDGAEGRRLLKQILMCVDRSYQVQLWVP